MRKSCRESPEASRAMGLSDFFTRQPEVPCSKGTEYPPKPSELLGYCHSSDRNQEITFGVKGKYVALGIGQLGVTYSLVV